MGPWTFQIHMPGGHVEFSFFSPWLMHHKILTNFEISQVSTTTAQGLDTCSNLLTPVPMCSNWKRQRWPSLISDESGLWIKIQYRILLNKRASLNNPNPPLLNLPGHTSETTKPISVKFSALDVEVCMSSGRDFHWDQTSLRLRVRFLPLRPAR